MGAPETAEIRATTAENDPPSRARPPGRKRAQTGGGRKPLPSGGPPHRLSLDF